MKSIISLTFLLSLAVVAATFIETDANGAGRSTRAAAPYHAEWPSTETAAAASSHSMPLPGPQDRPSADVMTRAGIAMIDASAEIDAAAAVLLATGEPSLVQLGEHWSQDARSLTVRGRWMIVTATSDAMVHEPEQAGELNLANLEANGAVMVAHGASLARHGQELIGRVDRLRESDELDPATLDALTASGEELIAIGERLERDGERMVDEAERLRRSLAL